MISINIQAANTHELKVSLSELLASMNATKSEAPVLDSQVHQETPKKAAKKAKTEKAIEPEQMDIEDVIVKDKAYSIEDCKAAMQRLMDAKNKISVGDGMEAVKQALTSVGVTKITLAKPDQYKDIINACNDLTAHLEA